MSASIITENIHTPMEPTCFFQLICPDTPESVSEKESESPLSPKEWVSASGSVLSGCAGLGFLGFGAGVAASSVFSFIISSIDTWSPVDISTNFPACFFFFLRFTPVRLPEEPDGCPDFFGGLSFLLPVFSDMLFVVPHHIIRCENLQNERKPINTTGKAV